MLEKEIKEDHLKSLNKRWKDDGIKSSKRKTRMKKPTKKQLKVEIDSIVASYLHLDQIIDQANSLGLLDIEGKLFNAIWVAFENLLDILEERLDTDLISHYIWDLRCGEKTNLTTEDIAKEILKKK